MNKKWKESEKQYVRDNCQVMKDREIAVRLTELAGRVVSIHAVRKLRQAMNLKKKPGRGVCEIVGVTPETLKILCVGTPQIPETPETHK